jgi:hypothetical protein
VPPEIEALRGGRNVLTPHPGEAYPGLRVIRPGEWDESLITPEAGQTIVALGGERVHPYQTIDGGRAEGFVLARGDRATVVVLGLPFHMAEWRIERARS